MTQSTPPHLLLPGIPLGPTTHVGVPGPQAPALARRELRSLAGMGGSPRRDAAGPREPGGQLGFGVKGLDPRIKLAVEIVEKELDRPLLVNIYSSHDAANRPSNFPASFNVAEPTEPAPPTPPPRARAGWGRASAALRFIADQARRSLVKTDESFRQ